MKRDKHFDQEKSLRKLYNDYKNTWGRRTDHGHWVDVEPYQKGWIRYFVPRDDIKNRRDIRYIRQALDLINNKVYSHREDFLRREYKTRKWVPIEQRLGRILLPRWEKLNLPNNVQKLFVKQLFREKTWWGKLEEYEAYCFKHEWYFVLRVEPNMVDQHWIPDSDWESHCKEIENKLHRDNLWPKIAKMQGWPLHGPMWREPNYLKHKYGEDIIIYDEDLEVA